MNLVTINGRATKEPTIRYTQGENSMCIAKFTLASDRKKRNDGKHEADFISCTAFGRTAEIIEKYVTKGTKILVKGHIQTGSYPKDGKKVYTTEVVIDEFEFEESKRNQSNTQDDFDRISADGFMDIADSFGEETPFT